MNMMGILVIIFLILGYGMLMGYQLGVHNERDRWRFSPKHRKKWMDFGHTE